MKTIKQIADEIGVSKQSVYKRYKGKLYSVCAPYTHTEHGVLYLDNKAENILKKDFKKSNTSNIKDTECSIGVSNVEPIEDEIISVLKKTIDTLQNQLDIKDSQIDKLTEALIISQKTSAAEQALHAGTMQKQLQASETEKEEVEVIEEKPSFWQRVFNKK